MDPSTLRNPWQRASRSASQMRCTIRSTINQHPLPGKDHYHQNSAETLTGDGCIPPSWQARPGGFGTTAFRPQQAQRTHAQKTKNRSFPNVFLWWGGPDNRACSSVTNTNQSESHSGHQQLRFTRNYMGAWRPEEDHQLCQCCWTGRVSEREEEEEEEEEEEDLLKYTVWKRLPAYLVKGNCCLHFRYLLFDYL